MKTGLIVVGLGAAAVVAYVLLTRNTGGRTPAPNFDKNTIPDQRNGSGGGENQDLRFADDIAKTVGKVADAIGAFANKKGD